jgi:queuine tRNA-ribosyltransferase
VLPTRLARNAALFTRQGRLNVRNARFERDAAPIEEGCRCYTCRRFSRAYLRHLFKAGELLGYRLATIHNVHFVLQLMREMREAIADDRFTVFKDRFLAGYPIIPHEVRAANRERRRGRQTSGREA